MIKSEKILKHLFFLSYLKDFVGTEKRVRIIHRKRAIRVRAIEVILYTVFTLSFQTHQLLTILVLKFEQFTIHKLCLKNAGWVANSVDPDEMPQSLSGSTLFAQAYLSKHIW